MKSSVEIKEEYKTWLGFGGNSVESTHHVGQFTFMLWLSE